MKCPKCGYHSFDHLENCKKCGDELAAHRSRFGLGSFILAVRGGAAFGGRAPKDDVGGQALPAEVPSALELSGGTEPAFSQAGTEGVAEASGDDVGAYGSGSELLTLAADDDFFALAAANATETSSGEVTGTPISRGRGAAMLAKEPVLLAPAGEGLPELLPSLESASVEWVSGEERTGEAPAAPEGADELAGQFLGSLPGSEEADITGGLHGHPLPVPEAETGIAEPMQYAGPVAGGAAPPDGEQAFVPPPLAGRLAAGGIDLLLLALLCVAFLLTGGLVLAPAGAGGALLNLASLLELSIPYFLVFFFVTFGYFTLFHYLTGQTPGKMLLRLRVEGTDGEPLLLSQAFLRSVGGLLSLLAVGTGFWRILFDRERRGWNDRFAGSRVVSADLFEGDAEFSRTVAENETADPF